MIGGVIFFLIEPNLLSQTKVETDHGFESWILGPYCRKYLSRRVEVLIHSSFFEWGVGLLRGLRIGPSPQRSGGRGWGPLLFPVRWECTTMCRNITTAIRMSSPFGGWKRTVLKWPLGVQHSRKTSRRCKRQ